MEILEKPWQGTSDELISKLESSKDGLSDLEAEKRLLKLGTNTITQKTPIPFLHIFFGQFTDLLVVMLIVASLLSFILGDSRNGIIIAIIVLINAIIGFSQEYKAQKILKALKNLLPENVKIKRGGEEKEIPSIYLVPGDLVILGEGDKVPADIRLLESYNLKVDEKTLTGEAKPQGKEINSGENTKLLSDVSNTLFMGTVVTSGEALGLITATGINTEFGKIAVKTTEIDKSLSPLQEKTARMSKRVALLAVFIVIFLVVYKYFIGRDVLDALIFSIAVAAALVPEGLPATISVALSLGARNLARKNALVRNLVSVETLGSVTVICTDKTGTLTTGQMTVKELWQPDFIKEDKNLLFETMVLCSDAVINKKGDFGDPTELALLKWAKEKGADIEKIRSSYRKVDEIPFSSKIKFMSVTFLKNEEKTFYLKGAPEVILKKCKLSQEEQNQIKYKFQKMAENGYRVLALAVNDIFLGLIAIYDPPRAEVKQSISECHNGGIKTIMITGDNALTAVAIGKEVGIIKNENYRIVEGLEIDRISDTELKNILLDYPVFSRVLPEHKYRIVENLMHMGEIVAVTGDGVNDAPALKRADIGIAMGKNGTDVSRESADMVLLDDNFATIVEAVKEGRAIFDNIKKFLFYIFSSNFGELLTVIIGLLLGMPLPITALEILSVDLGTDVLPSMALIFEPPESNIMKTKPRSKEVQLLTGESFLHLTLIGLIMGLGAILNFKYVENLAGSYQAATTAALATLVVMQAFNVFLSRCGVTSIFKYHFFKNTYLFLAEIFSFALILAIIYTGALNKFIITAAFPLDTWLRIFLSGLILLIIEEIYKSFKRKYFQGA